MSIWWKHCNVTQVDKELLATTREVADNQKREARSLLADAGRVAEVLRESRAKNGYREALDDIFGGKKGRRQE